MTTSDGISSDDWERVRELSVELFNALDTDQEVACRSELFGYLNVLEERYGLLPSIIATRGDFAENDADKEELLQRAYDLAMKRGDHKNAFHVAHSLANHYVDVKSVVNAGLWLNRLRERLAETPDVDLGHDLASLAAKFDDLIARRR